VRDIVSGIALIAIGLVFGGSIFRGEFSLFSVFFDGLGMFFIVRGVVRLYRAKQEAKPPA